MKKILICTLITLLFIASAALAAPGDVTLYMDLNGTNVGAKEVQCVATVKDTIYAACVDDLSDTDLLLIALKAGETEPQKYDLKEPESGLSLYNSKMFAWDDKLMLLDTSAGKLYEVMLADGQATLKETLQLQLVKFQSGTDEEDVHAEYDMNPWVEGNTLYTTLYNYYNGETLLAAYDLTDGTGRAVVNDLQSPLAVPGNEGELLYVTFNPNDGQEVGTLHTMSLQDGSSSEVCKLMTNEPSGLTYDATHNRVIYLEASTGVIYATALDGTQEELGTLPVTYPDGTLQYVPEGDYLVLGDPTFGLFVRNLDPQYKATRSLTIRCRSMDFGETFTAYTASHPDVAVNALTTDGSVTADEVTQAMMTGSSEADIYELTVDSNAFNAMVHRGYVADLSSSDILTEAVSRMYPQFADVLMKDGKVIAFPTQEYTQSFGFNLKLANQMGIAQPTTWDEFLDLVERWDADFSKDFPEKALYIPSANAQMKKTLMTNILTDYETLLNRPGQEQAFDTPALRHLLERLDQIDYAPFNSEKDFSMGYSWNDADTLIYPHGEFLPTSVGNIYHDIDTETPLLLSVDGETDPAVPMTMTVYVVNPYSQNQDLAIEYLEACVQTMPEYRQMLYFTDWTDPIENPDYETDLVLYDRKIAETQELLQNASPQEKQQYEQQLQNLEQERATFEKDRKYAYTEEQVKEYQDRVKYVVVMRNRYIYTRKDSGTDEMASIAQRYVDGQLEAGQMLKELDQKLRMMQMENDA